MRERIVLFLRISRPVTWVIVPMIFLLGFTYYGAKLALVSLLQLVLLSFPYSIFLYGINDIFDYKSDQINPRKQIPLGTKLEKAHHSVVWKVSLIIGLVLLSSAMMTLNLWNILIMCLLLFFSYQYSAPPLRLKERPPLDSISNGFIYFYAPVVLGASYSVPPFEIPFQLYFITVCVMSVHSLGTIMDYSVDKMVGDRTLAVVFGKRAASLFSLLIFTWAYFFAGYQGTVVHPYLLLCSMLAFFITLYPSERLTTAFFYIMGIGFIIVAIILIQYCLFYWNFSINDAFFSFIF